MRKAENPLNANPYAPDNSTSEVFDAENAVSPSKSVAFAIATLILAVLQYVGFGVAESLDVGVVPFNSWLFVYVPSLLIGFFGSIALFLRSSGRWRRIAAFIAIVLNVILGLVTGSITLAFM